MDRIRSEVEVGSLKPYSNKEVWRPGSRDARDTINEGRVPGNRLSRCPISGRLVPARPVVGGGRDMEGK
jgi:hypothetical protein